MRHKQQLKNIFLISIVVPFYNSSNKINFFLNSLSEQNLEDVEIIFIDDGSTDNTALQIKKYFSKKDISYKIISKSNAGVSSARNMGISASSAEYIMFIDSDDALLPEALNTIKLNLEIETADTYIFEYLRFSDNYIENIKTKVSLYKNKYNESKFYFREKYILGDLIKKVSMCSCVYKNEIISENKLRFDETLYYGEDQLFLLCNINVSNAIIISPSPILAYINHNASATNVFSLRWLDSVTMLDSLKNMPLFRGYENELDYRINFELLSISNAYIIRNSTMDSYKFISSIIIPRSKKVRMFKYLLLFKVSFIYIFLYKIYRKLK